MKNQMLEEMTQTITDPRFIKIAAKTVKQLGITAKEWNENRMMILMILYADMNKV